MKTMAKIGLILGVAAGLAYVGYQRLTPAQKRFVYELLRQTPYLIPRYFV
jgi:hypothetical protein